MLPSRFKTPPGREQPLYFSLNTGYQVSRVIANGVDIPFEDLEDDLIKRRTLRCTLPAEERVALRAEYGGVPQLWNISQTMLSGDLVSREELPSSTAQPFPRPRPAHRGGYHPFPSTDHPAGQPDPGGLWIPLPVSTE